MCHYEEWKEYKITCGAYIDGKCTPTPFNFQTIDDFYSADEAEKIKEHIKIVFGNRPTSTVVEALKCGDLIAEGYAQFLFDKDYSLYTAKQWGVSPDVNTPLVYSGALDELFEFQFGKLPYRSLRFEWKCL